MRQPYAFVLSTNLCVLGSVEYARVVYFIKCVQSVFVCT
jgi:hypothetical protein